MLKTEKSQTKSEKSQKIILEQKKFQQAEFELNFTLKTYVSRYFKSVFHSYYLYFVRAVQLFIVHVAQFPCIRRIFIIIILLLSFVNKVRKRVHL